MKALVMRNGLKVKANVIAFTEDATVLNSLHQMISAFSRTIMIIVYPHINLVQLTGVGRSLPATVTSNEALQ